MCRLSAVAIPPSPPGASSTPWRIEKVINFPKPSLNCSQPMHFAGEQNGYNIPELSAAPEVEKIFSEEVVTQLRANPEQPLGEQAKRLVCDAYMCFYQSPDVRMYR